MTHVPAAAAKNTSAATVNNPRQTRKSSSSQDFYLITRLLDRRRVASIGYRFDPLIVSVSGYLQRRFMVVLMALAPRRIVASAEFNDLVFERV